MILRPPRCTPTAPLFPSKTLFRSSIAYAGRPFFGSAWAALRHGRANMDVPVPIGVLLAAGVSIAELLRSGPHAYFDAAITLLFFLLVGDRKSTRLNSSHSCAYRMPSSA